MQIGLIGAGNMARALARGWGRPVLCSDPFAERAEALAKEVSGEALRSNAEVARRADLVVLCHKPSQLVEVAREIAPHARAVASILAATPLPALRQAYPDCPVYRFIPSLPVEVREGAIVQAADPDRRAAEDADGEALDAEVEALFAELGTLVVLPDELLDVAMGLMSCAPAYVALIAEAQVDAGIRRGIPAALGAQLVVQTLAGTAELLRRRGNDTQAVRREVASPGGVTARGLQALERAGVRGAFSDALDAVLGAPGRMTHAILPLASARVQIAEFLSVLIYVYILLIILYIVIQLLFSVGLRPSYSRTLDLVLGFLRDVAEPFLRIFRRFLPPFGGIDLSPILAIVTLEVIRRVVVERLIHG